MRWAWSVVELVDACSGTLRTLIGGCVEKVDTGIYRKPNGLLHVHTTAKCPLTGDILHRRKTLKEGATLDEPNAILVSGWKRNASRCCDW